MRFVETMGLAIPPGVASTLPRRVQDLLYGIYPPLLGYAGGGLFRSQEDIYNLANLVKLLEDWRAVKNRVTP